MRTAMNANTIELICVCFQDHAAFDDAPDGGVGDGETVDVEDPAGTTRVLCEDDVDDGLLFARVSGETLGVEVGVGAGAPAPPGDVGVGEDAPDPGVDEGGAEGVDEDEEELDAADPPMIENSGLALPESPINTTI